jgi:hypothetical protein
VIRDEKNSCCAFCNAVAEWCSQARASDFPQENAGGDYLGVGKEEETGSKGLM